MIREYYEILIEVGVRNEVNKICIRNSEACIFHSFLSQPTSWSTVINMFNENKYKL